jgi:Septum formation
MVAPAGVNEEVPQEPVKIRPVHAESAEREPAPVEGKLTAVPEAEPAAAPTGTELGETGLVEADQAEAELGDEEHADAVLTEAQPAEAGPAEAQLAEAGTAEAGTAEAELAETGGPGWDAAEERRDVSRLAVAGIILGVIALVGAAVGVLAVTTHGFRPRTVVIYRITYRPAAVFGLRPGECINSTGNGLNVTVLSCATPHDAEVFASFSLPAGAWPGASAVQQDAGNSCASRLSGYLNPQLASADLTQEYVYPNQAAWQAGERTVVCEVRAAGGQLTGSVRAPG